ncbi:MAG: hypothetical protein AAF697_00635 [Pseudomonadota bacterium]
MTDQDETGLSVGLKKLLIASLGGILMLFLLGYLAGYTAVALENETLLFRHYAMISGTAVLAILVSLACLRLWPESGDEIVSETTRKSNRLLQVFMALGVAIGVSLVIIEGPETSVLFSNGPVSSFFALFAIGFWLVVVPPLTWIWWRTVDEHEASAYKDGALVAGHVYLFLAPTWWVAARAGWVPAQDPMIVFLIIATLWSAVWLYRRYV